MMTFEEAVREFDKIVAASGELKECKGMPVLQIVQMMARIQTSQVKLLVYLMSEIEKLKGGAR